jgi:hypothetical protein
VTREYWSAVSCCRWTKGGSFVEEGSRNVSQTKLAPVALTYNPATSLPLHVAQVTSGRVRDLACPHLKCYEALHAPVCLQISTVPMITLNLGRP